MSNRFLFWEFNTMYDCMWLILTNTNIGNWFLRVDCQWYWEYWDTNDKNNKIGDNFNSTDNLKTQLDLLLQGWRHWL